MALFIDRHEIPGATAADIAAAHVQDLGVQDKYGVRFVTYWFEDNTDLGFCLMEGPDKETIEAAHREAHGLMPSEIIEVDETVVRGFFGRLNTHPPGTPYTDSAFRAILFTDIVDSTRLTQELGDLAAMNLLREHDTTVRSALARFGGSEVKHTGDGIMASFDSASRSIGAATHIQSALQAGDGSGERRLRVRIGIAAGEPVTEHDDLFGSAVQQAARLCQCAEPDRIVVSSGVYDLCRGKGIAFGDRCVIEVKGFDEPIEHYEVQWREPSADASAVT
jgi:class 3 adenylate cyclase